MLKDDADEEDALYRLECNGRSGNGGPVAEREVWFDREDLSIVRQKEYGVTIEVRRMEMNTEIAPGKFDLPQPPGVRLRVIE